MTLFRTILNYEKKCAIICTVNIPAYICLINNKGKHMTQEIQTVIDRHERAVAILERIKWNIRHIESLIDINEQMYSMFGSLSAPGKEKRDRSIAYRKRMGLLLTCEYESLVNNLHP